MIRSMTGYGHTAFELEGASFEVEVRSVNHRFLDLRVHLPRALAACELAVRTLVQERLSRGKVDVAVRPARGAARVQAVELDLEAARRYVAAAEALRERHGVAGALEVGTLLGLPGVARVTELELSPEAFAASLRTAVEAALAASEAMRDAEGLALARELEGRLDGVASIVAELEARADALQQAVRERLRKRAVELRRETGEFDEARLYQEIVLAADRVDVTEELVRLRSHVAQFRRLLAEGGPGQPVGRRLDFLLQELGREANTLGSKASDASAAHLVVELKNELERLREQVQNVE